MAKGQRGWKRQPRGRAKGGGTEPSMARRRSRSSSIRGMLPKNSLGRAQIKKLKVYAGAEHPHAAQQPTPFTLDQVAQ